MTSRTKPKTILLGGTPRHEEAPAANANVRPGMLLAKTSAGAVRPHNVAAGLSRLVAREADFVGASIDDVYESASADRVQFYHAQPGDRFYMLLAAGQDVAVGAYLESNGAGYLRAQTTASQLTSGNYTYTPAGNAIFRALEAVDNDPGTDSLPVRIKVEAI